MPTSYHTPATESSQNWRNSMKNGPSPGPVAGKMRAVEAHSSVLSALLASNRSVNAFA